MLEVIIIGGGNVALQLARAFTDNPIVRLSQVLIRDASRSFEMPAGVSRITDFAEIGNADIYVIAVSDKAIAEVAMALPANDALVVHTSGMTDVHLPGGHRYGVLYPLQSFSNRRVVNFREVPVCIEAELPSDEVLLRSVAGSISDHVYVISADQRKALHVAAVFANNFVNHMYVNAQHLCNQHNLDFDMLKPLIAETAAKINDMDPEDAQTGPAGRNDQVTIDAHLALLQDSSHREIYKLITNSIQRNVKKL